MRWHVFVTSESTRITATYTGSELVFKSCVIRHSAMSTLALSTVTDSPASMDSTCDMGFGDSDDDDFSTEDNYGDMSVADYWFGKKYFECVGAQHLLHHQGFTGDMAAIDVKSSGPRITVSSRMKCRLTTMLQAYPYQQVLQRLSAIHGHNDDFNGNRNSCHEFRGLLTKIGWIIRTGTREMRAQLLEVLRQPLPHSTCGLSEPVFRRNDGFATLSASDRGKYASALNEYGQEHGFVTTCRYETRPANSLTCIAVALCGEKTFRASAKNKKMARHAAAFQACEHFGIII